MEGGEGGETDRCLSLGQRKVRGFDFQMEKLTETGYNLVHHRASYIQTPVSLTRK